MQYRTVKKTGTELSALGFGCMRFPTQNDDPKSIQESKAIDMLRHSIEAGVNFLDTAYVYHGGESEVLLGKALSNSTRKKVYLSTKIPVAHMEKETDFNSYLDEQLRRLQTDYIDFYFLHALNPVNWEKVHRFNVLTHLDKAKQEGKIRYPAFSFHSGTELFKEIIDTYDWIMTLVQFNYLDEHYQAGIEGIRYASENQVAVAAMEPLRGGNLVNNPPNEVVDVLQRSKTQKTLAELGLSWVLNHEEITTTLSGMSSLEEVEENIGTASQVTPNSLPEEELQLIDTLKEIYLNKIQINCTDCRYCLPCDVKNIPIPVILSLYNEMFLFENNQTEPKAFYRKFSEKKRDGSACIQCGVCEERCPQGLPISEWLEKAHRVLSS